VNSAQGGNIFFKPGGSGAAAGTVTGTGVAAQVAVFTAANTIAGYTNFTSDSSANVKVNSLGVGTAASGTAGRADFGTTFILTNGVFGAGGSQAFDFGGGTTNFHTSINPSGNNSSDCGINGFAWRDGYFARSIGVGVAAPGVTGQISADFYAVKSGANLLAGTVTLANGAATITSNAITANTVIAFSLKSSSGTPSTYQPLATVSANSAAVTGAATDNSTYNWVGFIVS